MKREKVALVETVYLDLHAKDSQTLSHRVQRESTLRAIVNDLQAKRDTNRWPWVCPEQQQQQQRREENKKLLNATCTPLDATHPKRKVELTKTVMTTAPGKTTKTREIACKTAIKDEVETLIYSSRVPEFSTRHRHPTESLPSTSKRRVSCLRLAMIVLQFKSTLNSRLSQKINAQISNKSRFCLCRNVFGDIFVCCHPQKLCIQRNEVTINSSSRTTMLE